MICEANICQDDAQLQYNWFADEAICTKRPFAYFQRIQKRIAKLATKYPAMAETFHTTAMLQDIKSVRKGIAGKKPSTKQPTTMPFHASKSGSNKPFQEMNYQNSIYV